jgi:tetratricopeptide (TPR) repeat protein
MSRSRDIFVCYRREGDEWRGIVLYDRLRREFGEDRVFFDVDTLPPGAEFAKAIKSTLKSTQVLVALIGPHWSEAADKNGNRKLESPGDYVAVEIGTAFEQGIEVIPVLFDGASLPPAEELPEPLRPLPGRNYVRFQAEYVEPGLARLVAQIRTILDRAPTPGERPAPTPRPLPPIGLLPPKPLVFGRTKEIDRLLAHLSAKEPWPVPVVGGPGYGKSAVCIAALHRRAPIRRFGDRRYFVRCDGAPEAGAMVTLMASSLGLRSASDEVLPQVVAKLRQGPAALVLDNLETPWESDEDATVELLRMLAAIQPLVLIASIRGKVRPPGIDWAASVDVEPLNVEPARKLFLAVAGHQYVGDRHLDALVKEQDGVPLSLHLVAQLAQGEPNLAGLWQRWEARRHVPIRAERAFELSIWSPRTSEPGRRLLRLLGVLPNGIAYAEIANLLPECGQDAASNLRRVGLAFDERERIRVLQPIRSHVQRTYEPDPEDLMRAVRHYFERGSELGRRTGGPGGSEASAQLAAEIGNLDSLLNLRFGSDDPRPAIDTAVSLSYFMRFSGLGYTRLLESAYEAATRLGDVRRRASVLKGIGQVAFVRSERDVAAARFQEARRLLEEELEEPDRQDDESRAECIKALGHIARADGQLELARVCYTDALELFTSLEGDVGRADSIAGLADLDSDRGRLDEAERRYLDAHERYVAAGHLRGIANCIADRGMIALLRGQPYDARSRFQVARPLYERVGHLHGLAKCDFGLADVAVAAEEFDLADQLFGDAAELYHQVGDQEMEARVNARRAEARGLRPGPGGA